LSAAPPNNCITTWLQYKNAKSNLHAPGVFENPCADSRLSEWPTHPYAVAVGWLA
jgi:hypothetical protein